MNQIWLWIAFNIFVLIMLFLDLAVFHRKPHSISIREALIWSVFWIVLALLFNLGIYHFRGHGAGLTFFTGYVLEKSLSVDNLFVFLLIFNYFQVPQFYQHRVLFWGIAGALVMRTIFIFGGIALIRTFHWIIYAFGAFLVFTGVKLFQGEEKEIDPEKNVILKIFCRFMPVVRQYEGNKFFVKKDNKWFATPLMIVVLVVETTDVLFALDSIPAILSLSKDSFIVYTSNVFAILGLRALYFALAGMMTIFHYLHYGLGVILAFVGVKMLLEGVVNIPVGAALGVIAAILFLSVVLSLIFPKGQDRGET